MRCEESCLCQACRYEPDRLEYSLHMPPLPLSAVTMLLLAKDGLFCWLAKANKIFEEIKKMVDLAYLDNRLSRATIYQIIKKFKLKKYCTDWHFFWTMRQLTPPLPSKIGGIVLISNILNLSDLILVDFFLFRKVKELLAGITLSQESLKTAWEGVGRSISKEEFAVVFCRWYEPKKICIRIGSG